MKEIPEFASESVLTLIELLGSHDGGGINFLSSSQLSSESVVLWKNKDWLMFKISFCTLNDMKKCSKHSNQNCMCENMWPLTGYLINEEIYCQIEGRLE